MVAMGDAFAYVGLPVAAKKISGENDGTAHSARQLSALLKLCGTRKCEEGYSQIS
jgi:hypothetical protein